MKPRPEVEEFIAHHGVKGMKWGVRKSRSSISKNPASEDHSEVSALKKKKKHELSDKQLERVNKRLNLEKNYNKLNPTTIKRGAIGAAAILSTLQTASTVYNLATSPAGKAAISNARKVIEGRAA
jgi:hypothetical protein